MVGRSIALGQRWLSGSWLMGPAESRSTIWRAISFRCRRIFDSWSSRSWSGNTSPLRQRGLARRFQPLFSQKPHRGIGVHRLAEGKALRVFAAELIELDRVRIGLRAFGDDVHAEVVGERDDRFQDHRARAAAGGSHEGLVDLDGVERKALQIGERGMAGAEIIKR